MAGHAAGAATRPAPRGVAVAAPFVLVGAGGLGLAAARLVLPVANSRYFPWIVGRGLGLAAFGCLSLLVALGLWSRHPWRLRVRLLHPETTLRLHAALAAGTLVLVAGHVIFLATDRYAGVGWVGALLPGAAAYRPVPVALGVGALWTLLAIAATARLGGRLVGRAWLPVHHLALLMFAAAFVHGVLAGSDTPALRVAYGVVGAAIVALWLTRRLARPTPVEP